MPTRTGSAAAFALSLCCACGQTEKSDAPSTQPSAEPYSSPPDTPPSVRCARVKFADPGLEQSLRRSLKLAPADVLTPERLREMKQFNAGAVYEPRIVSLEGLQCAENLEFISLRGGGVSLPILRRSQS